MNGFRLYRMITLALIIIAGCSGCDEGEKGNGKGNGAVQNYSVSFIEKPAGGKTFSSGEPVEVILKLRSQPEDFDSVFIWIDDKLVLSSSEKKESYAVSVQDTTLSMGSHTIRTRLKTKSNAEENKTTFTLVSDITPKSYTYNVVSTFKHDSQAYTQGLEFDNGTLYEGTGLEGLSEIRTVNLMTGDVIKNKKIDNQYFGEGITILGDKLYQLTYRHRIGFVYDKKSFEQIGEFRYNSEGWGLTNDGKNLIMSDGSNKLTFINPESLQIIKTVEVYDDRGPQYMLNELEFINGEIWANVYQTETIVIIEPSTGKVKGKINLSGIIIHESGMDVLNGIAYDKRNGKIYVTGKRWPKIFEIQIKEAAI